MSKSFLNLLGIALVSGSVMLVGSSQAQAAPEVSATSEQNMEAAHSTSALEEIPSSSVQDVKVANRSETAGDEAAVGQAVAKTENPSSRIPCVSRIFPSLMQ